MNVTLTDSSSRSAQRARNIAVYVLFIAISLFSIIYGLVTAQYDFVIFGGACLLGVIVAGIAGATAGPGILYPPEAAFWIIFGLLLVAGILVMVL